METKPKTVKQLLKADMTILPNGEWEDYTRIPNVILKASNLSCQAKVALALLIGTYQYASDTKSLGSDGQFFFVNDRFEDFTDVTGRQFVSTAIKELLNTRLIESKQRGFGTDRKNYYTLNWYRIFNYDGQSTYWKTDNMKKSRAAKANAALKEKEDRIIAKYYLAYKDVIETATLATEGELTEGIVDMIRRDTKWKEGKIYQILARMKKMMLTNPNYIPEAKAQTKTERPYMPTSSSQSIPNGGWANLNTPHMQNIISSFSVDEDEDEDELI